ncbi:MAG: hypothetical protein AAGD38_21485 [Acidobacteriota bacterium]
MSTSTIERARRYERRRPLSPTAEVWISVLLTAVYGVAMGMLQPYGLTPIIVGGVIVLIAPTFVFGGFQGSFRDALIKALRNLFMFALFSLSMWEFVELALMLQPHLPFEPEVARGGGIVLGLVVFAVISGFLLKDGVQIERARRKKLLALLDSDAPDAGKILNLLKPQASGDNPYELEITTTRRYLEGTISTPDYVAAMKRYLAISPVPIVTGGY